MVAPASQIHPLVAPNHRVQFYDTEEHLCDVVARFLLEGLNAGEPLLVVASETHRHAFLRRLRESTAGVERALKSGQLVMLDARETMSQFMVDGMPDGERFRAVLGEVVARSVAGHRQGSLRIYGEMVDLLWRDGNRQAAIVLEELWNHLGHLQSFSLLCAYIMANFYRAEDGEQFRQLCANHSHVMPAESRVRIDGEDQRERQINILQQRSRALETEIAHRMELESALRDALADRSSQRDRSQELYRQLVDSVKDYAIFRLSRDGHVATWNRGAQEIKGYAANEIIGKHFSTFYPEEDLSARKPEHELEEATRVGRFEDEGWRVRKDGSRFWANVIITALRDDSGQLVGFGKVTRDLTERKHAEDQRVRLAQAEEALAARKRTDELRELIMGMVSHDLRSPLNAIVMAVGLLLKRGGLGDGDAKIAARIARSADRMTHMISQLLDFTGARMGGGIALAPAPADLSAICGDTIAELQMTHPQRTILFAPDVYAFGAWDGHRLGQVVSNLVGNGIRYGSPTEPVIVTLRNEGESTVLEVHNQGPPIPPELLPSIFEPFRRAQETGREVGSLGLGLYITAQIVAAHGGEITVRSTEEAGTTFTVRLPRKLQPA